MNAGLHNIEMLMQNRFKIPIYQRHYSWKKKHIQRLIHDTMAQTDKKHFTGVFFFKTIQNGLDSKKQIIDGQQRLTTIFLIIKALFDLKKEYNYENSECLTSTRYERVFYDANNVLSLELLDKDMDSFKRLFIDGDAQDDNGASLIHHNYNIIKSEIKSLIAQKGINVLDDVYKKIIKLDICVIDINPDADEDAQEIFESLNSKNELLTSSALLKNHIFMAANDKDINDIFEIWKQTEKNAIDMDDFVPNFIIAKRCKSIPQPKNYYQDYKDFVFEQKWDRRKEIDELFQYSIIYSYLIQNKIHPCPKINEKLKALLNLHTTSYYPLAIRILKANRDNEVSNEITYELLKSIECFIVRRGIINRGYRGNHTIMWEKFSRININKQTTIKDFNRELFYDNLLDDYLAGGTNDQLKDAISTSQIYQNRIIAKFLLKSIEEYLNPSTMLNFSELEIEHIIPQKSRDGNSSCDPQYIHNIGNLTLISKVKNKRISNKSFNDKKKEDYSTSNITITNDLSKMDDFTVDHIKKRGQRIAEIALKLWPINI